MFLRCPETTSREWVILFDKEDWLTVWMTPCCSSARPKCRSISQNAVTAAPQPNQVHTRRMMAAKQQRVGF